MGMPLWIGYVAFFGVPAAIWLVAAATTKRKGVNPFLSLVAGSDGRLSVSRLQALLWTFVVFGAFAAAMVVRTNVTQTPGGPEEPADWVKIPNELLQLAGIAISSGVLSSLVAAVQDEGKRAVVKEVKTVDGRAPGDPNLLEISGENLGTGGRVKVAGTTTVIKKWSANSIRVQFPAEVKRGPLTVDTANGKECYSLTGEAPSFEKGEPTTCYELADLFREDKSATGLSLMKFQMFGWTMIAIVLYALLFLSRLNPTITTLPTVDPSIVTLTGVSQAGYLVQKAVSGISPSDKQAVVTP